MKMNWFFRQHSCDADTDARTDMLTRVLALLTGLVVLGILASSYAQQEQERALDGIDESIQDSKQQFLTYFDIDDINLERTNSDYQRSALAAQLYYVLATLHYFRALAYQQKSTLVANLRSVNIDIKTFIKEPAVRYDSTSQTLSVTVKRRTLTSCEWWEGAVLDVMFWLTNGVQKIFQKGKTDSCIVSEYHYSTLRTGELITFFENNRIVYLTADAQTND